MQKGQKMSEAQKKYIGETKKGNRYFFGKIHTPEARQKIRDARAKQTFSPETRKKISDALKNRIVSIETRKKLSESARRGKENNLWKGGITPINISIRTSLEMKLWREAVFKRDDYICVQCGARNGNGKKIILHADHIKPFSLFPDLRFAIDNGRTLCVSCHRKTDTYGNKMNKYKFNIKNL